MKAVTKSGVKVQCPILQAGLLKAFSDMRSACPTVTMSPDQQSKAIHATQKFVHVAKSKYVTAHKAREGLSGLTMF